MCSGHYAFCVFRTPWVFRIIYVFRARYVNEFGSLQENSTNNAFFFLVPNNCNYSEMGNGFSLEIVGFCGRLSQNLQSQTHYLSTYQGIHLATQ